MRHILKRFLACSTALILVVSTMPPASVAFAQSADLSPALENAGTPPSAEIVNDGGDGGDDANDASTADAEAADSSTKEEAGETGDASAPKSDPADAPRENPASITTFAQQPRDFVFTPQDDSYQFNGNKLTYNFPSKSLTIDTQAGAEAIDFGYDFTSKLTIALNYMDPKTNIKKLVVNSGVKAKNCLYSAFYNWTALENVDLSGVTLVSDSCDTTHRVEIGTDNWLSHGTNNADAAFRGCTQLTSVKLPSGANAFKPSSCRGMFESCTSLATLDLANLNTSNTTSMREMFLGCTNLSNLALANFNTANVTDMNSMFQNCPLLQTLNLSFFDTSKVTNMGSMFKACSGLTNITFPSNLNTSKVTDMSYLFSACSNLSSLNLAQFNTINVTNMESMFSSCTALSSLSLSNFNTAKVTNMQGMFSSCNALDSLNLSSFNTAAVTNMNSMFFASKNLRNITFSANFNTSRVNDMFAMFYGCALLTSLDLSSFNTSSVTNMDGMFSDCKALASLNLSNFDFTNVMLTLSDIGLNLPNLQSISVSAKFPWANSIVLPSGNWKWWSAAEKEAFTSSYIAEKRRDKADTYTRVEVPQQLSGRAATWKKGSGLPLVMRSSAPIEQFVGVTYDGTPLSGAYWTKRSGSTIIEITASFMEQRQPGTHTFEIKSWGGTASFAVTIEEASAVTPPPTQPENPPAAEVQKKPVYRLYNKWSGDHLFTTSEIERETCLKNGWTDEQIGWETPADRQNGVPVYRLYNPYNGDHHFTKSEEEYNKVIEHGWKGEGIAYYSSGERPVYRLYNPFSESGYHHWTTNREEFDKLVLLGWTDEGIGFYAF